ncbi:MAG: phenylalanine--tRNA ligase subunit beta [Alloprevotella sp.]|nr:phenylalanine--tRNA ligase subunit beta [Alloprevotella sp.]
MNISYKWLKDYVDFSLSPEELAAALTSVGLEVGGVEEVESIRGGLKGIVVGEVLTCEPHPDSDHMHVCTVCCDPDATDGTEAMPLQIVCGAPNVAAGQKVMVATIGTVLYDGDKEFQIKKSKLRGVESYGMICAEDEIGVGTSHDGIIVLPADTKVGTPAAEYYKLESDYLIEVDITPNHSDACSHWGVARDLYAWLRRNGYETSLHRLSVEGFKVDSHALEIGVRVENAEACPHYCAVTVKGCEVKESPEWLRRRLETIGLRPINNIVDITNYVMMAFGQPLHCFDADMIEGKTIVVKTLPEGTPFVTLDGVEHKLSDRDLAICNEQEPMCIAGVFGGKGSGTYETTTDVCFESAYFHPTWIRKSSRRHQLQTDASFRFERGIDPAGQVYALKVAAMMTKELAGGEIAMDIKDVWARELPQTFAVDLSYQYCDDLIGKVLPREVIQSICEDLGMKATPTADGLHLDVPAYRVDVQRPCDVVEEILRIYGYNNIEIPTRLNACLTVQGEDDRSWKLQSLVGEQLVGQGFHEILNNSLTKEAYYDGLGTYKSEQLVRLVNPLSADLNVLRQTLLFGGLESIARNVNRRAGNLRFFEMGKHYRSISDEAVATHSSEEYHLGLWLTGNRVEGSWAHADEKSSVYELKAYAYGVLQRIGLPMGGLLTEDSANDIFSHGLALKDRNGKVLLEFGIVSKKLCALCGVEQEVYFADLHWDELMKKTRKQKVEFQELSKFPAVSRDLALLVDADVRFGQIEEIALRADRKLIKAVRLFDVYEGKNLPAGKKSYAINFTLQDDTRTMNDKQVEAVMQRIVNNLSSQLNAQLR